MDILVIIALLVPTILGRTTYSSHDGISIEDVEEIQKLKALTKKLEESGEDFLMPLQHAIKVSKDDVSFSVYNQENPEGQEVLMEEASQIASVSSFNTNLQTVFVIHGWHTTITSKFNAIVIKAFLKIKDINLINVSWDGIAKEIYLEAYSAVPQIGVYVGDFIKNVSTAYNYPLNKISLVGHSLGAHIAGFAGQETDGHLYSITGLDPAGPLYFHSKPESRLSEDDAQYVQAIHTNAALLGVSYDVAHADYWPNGGYHQPGCSLDITGSCSHGRSYYYFNESLTSDDFIAKQCNSYNDYAAGKCKYNAPTIMGGALVNTTITGTYYLGTNSSSPYALGETDL